MIDVQRNSISLKWKQPSDDGGSPLTGFIVEKRHESGKFWSKATKVSADITECCVTELQENSMYYFRVIAENKVGESEPLETKDATMAKSPFSKEISYLFYNYVLIIFWHINKRIFI